MEQKRILFASSEVDPFAKTGGLADVAASLKALCGLGHDVRVVMPKYKNIPMQYVEKMEFVGSIQIYVAWDRQYCGILKLEAEGVTYYFIDNEYYFGRDGCTGTLMKRSVCVFQQGVD